MAVSDDIRVSAVGKADEERWNAFLAKAYNGSWRLNLGFQKARESRRRNLSAFIFSVGDDDIAAVLYTLNSAVAGLLRVAAIRHGIMFRHESDYSLLPVIVAHFSKWASERKAACATVAPWLPMKIDGDFTEISDYGGTVLEEAGYSPVAGGMHTYLIDLSLSEEDMLLRMNRSTRKLVRRGPRSALRFEVVSSPDEELLGRLWTMYHSLSEKKHFGALGRELFIRRAGELCSRGQAVIFLTWCGYDLISFTLVSLTGTPSGMYGAIDPGFREMDDCISPGPASVWEIVTYLRDKGFRYYDMGFCPGPVPQKDHPEYNVWLFKYNFGPLHLQYMPVYGKVLKPVTGRAFRWIKYGRGR
ncbi:MAG: GNAT family N-acetyltransferase [Bacteroidales bacterium]|jgi:hypothetical protein|nr:GNAT family N-acetyltransferase [Bacteroidales bacterium]